MKKIISNFISVFTLILLAIGCGGADQSTPSGPYTNPPGTTNHSPAITSSPATTVNEGGTYSYQAFATDFENDVLTYSFQQSPPWLIVNPTSGLITGTAPHVVATTQYSVVLKVSDGISSPSTQLFAISVVNTMTETVTAHVLHKLTSNSSFTIYDGESASVDVSASSTNETGMAIDLDLLNKSGSLISHLLAHTTTQNSYANTISIGKTAYAGAGDFQVRLTVTGNTGEQSVSSIELHVVTPYPQEAWPKTAEIRMSLPPQGWTAGVTWVVAVHDGRIGGASSMQVDWVRFYCTVGGVETLVAGEFAGNGTGVDWSGLYLRNPWFANDTSSATGVSFTSDIATLPIDTKPSNVWHFGTMRPAIPAGSTRCYGKTRVKPEGSALVQVGVDFWKDTTIGWCGLDQCNTEGSGSDWYKATGDWMIITSGI